MKFSFVQAEKDEFPVAVLCELLEVSRQGYYAWAKRPISERTRRDAELIERVKQVHNASRRTYGSPRVLHALRRDGMRVSKRRVERAMQAMGLAGRRPRRYVVTTRADGTHRVEPNKLAREFTASKPNERWVTDITHIWTDDGWVYLAAIIDLYSRAVVGWAMETTMSTTLVKRALNEALQRRRPKGSLLHHSDRGTQYTAQDYREILRQTGIDVSMSRKGNCWDNAVAESFFATLKCELVHTRRWSNRWELKSALFEYIEVFYNRRRLHSTLGYRTPAEVEQAYELCEAA